MATNSTKKNTRKKMIRNRSQFQGQYGNYIKRNTENDQFMDVKTSDKSKFKRVKIEEGKNC